MVKYRFLFSLRPLSKVERQTGEQHGVSTQEEYLEIGDDPGRWYREGGPSCEHNSYFSRLSL